ncbi:hypothetical protein [Methanosarcina siciliae]|uniref:hypothetical protein n=1 Tax=Methanosarcina siciliae TaxID=38027 RepID=UPI0012E0B977|nr:hypothetical protein [Methanosarcina siciliae]
MRDYIFTFCICIRKMVYVSLQTNPVFAASQDMAVVGMQSHCLFIRKVVSHA